MKTMPTALQKLPKHIAHQKAMALALGEREMYSVKEIADWKALSKGERHLLIGIRQHMRPRTSMKGSKGWTSAKLEQLAEYSGYEKRQVRRLLKGLKSKKVLNIIGKGTKKGGPGSRRGYAIHKQSCCYQKPLPKTDLPVVE